MATNITHTAPYFDDFDESKNYHQILFRPGFAVQARELTQIQSILKNQIEQFGNHIFRQGSIVIPGNSRGDLSVAYVKVLPTYNTVPINIALFDGETIKGQTSGVTAIVRKTVDKTSTDPITFYVSYLSGGVVDNVANGQLTFSPGETLLINGTSIGCTIENTVSAIGIGSLAYVNKGVYYVNGTFVHVDTQSTVIDKYGSSPSCHVLLSIQESIVDSTMDDTLLDPAQGSYNFAAPGADRYKISLTLTTLPIDSVINDNYVEIMRYRDGVLEEHARTPKYNELEKSLARRTYDESGDYVVNGLYGVISEHKRVSNNGGIFTDGDENKFAITVAPGKAYIGGFEIEKISPTVFALDKARTSAHVGDKTFTNKLSYGQYIYVTNVKGNLGIETRSEIQFFNSNDNTNVSAINVGSARCISIDYLAGDPATNDAIYKLYHAGIALNSAYSLTDIGGIRVGNLGTTASATVLHRVDAVVNNGTLSNGNIISTASGTKEGIVHLWRPAFSEVFVYKNSISKPLPIAGELFTSGTVSAVIKSVTSTFATGQTSALFKLPVSVAKSIKTNVNTYAHKYVVQKHLQFTTNSSGNGSVTISDGEFRPPEPGTFVAFNNSGVIDISLFDISVSGTQLTITGGPVSDAITVHCVVEKTGLVPRTKTLTTGVTSISSYNVSQTLFDLIHSDVYQITLITDSTGNITNNFTLINNQTDYFYDNSKIQLLNGKSSPVGTLTVTYKYFSHGAGDFFTIDSYAGNVGNELFVLNYKTSAGDVIDLRNYIDFRASKSNGTFSINDMVVNGERFTSPLQFYMGRYDLLTINKDGTVAIEQGIPAENPKLPTVSTDSLALEKYFVPPFTPRCSDISYARYQVTRFTMSDINKLSNRVQRLEEYSTLNATESDLLSLDVIDVASGLSRFKTGYLSETFQYPLTIADTSSTEFRATFEQGGVAPSVDMMLCPLTLNTAASSGYIVKNNSVIMLPFTESIFAQQNVSSRVTNLNPFMVIKWDGTLTVEPSRDSWTETLDLPTIFRDQTETVTVTTWVPAPVPPVVPCIPTAPPPPPVQPPVQPPTPPVIVPPIVTPPAPAAQPPAPPAAPAEFVWIGGFGTFQGVPYTSMASVPTQWKNDVAAGRLNVTSGPIKPVGTAWNYNDINSLSGSGGGE